MIAIATAPDGFAAAVWLVVALSLAGVAHVLWLKSPLSRRWSLPLDGGLTIRGRRVLGPNKTVRGLAMMPLGAMVAFFCIAALRDAYPAWLARGFWDLPPATYALVGLACGFGFMLAELPNSFLKRQLDVSPGEEPRQAWLRPLCLVIDRVDSTVGVLVVLTIALPVSAATWAWMLLLGPASHAAFSAWMFHARLKARAL